LPEIEFNNQLLLARGADGIAAEHSHTALHRWPRRWVDAAQLLHGAHHSNASSPRIRKEYDSASALLICGHINDVNSTLWSHEQMLIRCAVGGALARSINR
jgi:hypothetical protein